MAVMVTIEDTMVTMEVIMDIMVDITMVTGVGAIVIGTDAGVGVAIIGMDAGAGAIVTDMDVQAGAAVTDTDAARTDAGDSRLVNGRGEFSSRAFLLYSME